MTQCGCGHCDIYQHTSDCAVHNMPAYPNGNCTCGMHPHHPDIPCNSACHRREGCRDCSAGGLVHGVDLGRNVPVRNGEQ